MRIVITDANGWIGGAITDHLLALKHEVLGIVRSKENGEGLIRKGAIPAIGDLNDTAFLKSTLEKADGVVFASAATKAITLGALNEIITMFSGTHKPVVYISGSSLYGDIGEQQDVGEQVFIDRLNTSAMTHTPEETVYRAKDKGVRSSVLVGAGILYGRNGGSTPSFWLNDARQRRLARYIGMGNQRWSAVHVDDLAVLAGLMLDQAPEGSVFNAAAESILLREAAEAVAQALKLPKPTSISEATAVHEWGSFWGHTLAHNLWVSGERAKHTMGWNPTAPSFIEDVTNQP